MRRPTRQTSGILKQALNLLLVHILCCSLIGVFVGCSLIVDPTVCERDSDCGGGVCQVGICIGPRTGEGDPNDQGGPDAGSDMDGLSDMNMRDMITAGDEVDPDMSLAGEDAGEQAMDAMIPQDVTCDFELNALVDQGVHRRDLPPDIHGASSWATHAEELELRVRVTPAQPQWLSLARIYIGDVATPLTEEGELWVARVPLPEQGDRQVRFSVEDADQVLCFDQFNLLVDREAPELLLVSPSSPDSWIGELSDVAEARVNLEGQDLARLNWSVSRDAQVVASESGVMSGSWSTDLPLVEGVNTFTITATDELDQSSTMEIVLRYDPQAPGVVLSAPPSDRLTVETPTFTFSGLITEQVSLDGSGGTGQPEGDARVVITSRRGADGSGEELDRQLTRSGEDGSFSATLSLVVGAQRIEVCGYDFADNSSCVSAVITRVEAEPCVNISSSAFSLTANYTLSGDVCSSVTTLSLSINEGDPINIPLSGESFNYPLTLAEASAPQLFTLTASAADGASATGSISVIWDNSPPIVLISQPERGACFNGQTVTLCGRVIDGESGTRSVSAQGQAIDLSDQVEEGEAWWENFCVEIDADDIDDTINLRGENGAGAITSDSVEVTVDRVAPSVELPPGNTWFRADDRGVVEIPGRLIISGCGLTAQGFRIYSLFEESGELVRGRSLSPQLEENSEFIYREEYPEGAQQLEVVLIDRATNERVTRYAFKVDGTAPQLELTSHTPRTISSNSTPTFTFESSDLGSGLDLTSGRLSTLDPNGDLNDTPLTVTPIEGEMNRYTLSATLNLGAGEHLISASVSDTVGNARSLELSYVVDLDPPTVRLLSHQEGSEVVDGEVVILEVSDALSSVSLVEVNGVIAETFGALWIVSGVPINSAIERLNISAEDEAGNTAQGDEVGIAVNLSPYIWRPAAQLGAPHPGYTLRDGSQSLDTSRGLTELSWLWWASNPLISGSLSGLFTVAPDGAPAVESGVAVGGGFSLNRFGSRLSARPQQRFLASDQLIMTQRATVHGALTLFTLEASADETNEEGALRLWQRGEEVSADQEVSGDPVTDDDEWVEVRLGLPEQLNLKTFLVGDVSGNGRVDLIGVTASGALLFTLDEDGSFRFEGAAGLAQRGLGGLDGAVERLWWVELNDTPTSDTPPDLVAQRSAGVSAWISSLGGGSYQYTEVVGFPEIATQRAIDGWTHLDWDGDGALDPVAWSSGEGGQASLLRRYTITGDQWGVTPLLADEFELPTPLVAVEWSDLDVDETLEVLCVGSAEMMALESQSGTLSLDPASAWSAMPARAGVSAILDVVTPADIDQDGDEDWLFGLRLPTPLGVVPSETRGELWGLISDPQQLTSDHNPITIRIQRGDAEGRDALGVTIRVNRDDDLNFERAYPARPFSETLINTQGAGSIDLQVVFPDRGATGGNVITLFEVNHGSTVTVVDDQE